MSKKWTAPVLILGLALFSTHGFAQTSVALSAYGAFHGTTTGQGTYQSPANQAGGMIELRHIANPILGFEATYSFNRADQKYSTNNNGITCPTFGCTISTETVRANAHEITADWVPSLGIGSFRPFGVLGVGVLLNVPDDKQATVITTSPCYTAPCPASPTTTASTPTTTSTQAVYVYGAGLDWGLLPHLGLRVQYRGNLYEAPNVTQLFSSTKTFTRTSEPMIGAYFNF